MHSSGGMNLVLRGYALQDSFASTGDIYYCMVLVLRHYAYNMLYSEILVFTDYAMHCIQYI